MSRLIVTHSPSHPQTEERKAVSGADKVDGAGLKKPWSRPPSNSPRPPTPISGDGVARMDLDLGPGGALPQSATMMPCIPLRRMCQEQKKGGGGRVGNGKWKMGWAI